MSAAFLLSQCSEKKVSEETAIDTVCETPRQKLYNVKLQCISFKILLNYCKCKEYERLCEFSLKTQSAWAHWGT